jgi:hypothetical protein
MGSKATATVGATLTFAGLVFLACGASTGTASADPPAPPAPKKTMDHDGTYSVGTDIVAGTYSSAGPVGSGTCYWKRMDGPNGSDIIDNAMSKKPQVVRIEPSDKAFKTSGCQPWQSTDSINGDETIPADGPSAGAQLHTNIDTLNGLLGQFGGGQQVPQP